MMHALLLLLALALTAGAAGADASWRLPLSVKEKALEQNIRERHNILGLYPSQVEVPLDGRPVDNSTLGIGNIAHSVCWTANYLAGCSFRYAFLKQSGAPQEEVDAALRRADEVFEAVYRCQLVTGVRGLQARGYAIGHGESYEERWDAQTRDEWHQGAGEFGDLRWRGDPSHHNYSDASHGLIQYYTLAAQGKQKDRAREAIDALVSYWVDNDLNIHKLDRTRPPVPILGMTDGKTLNTRVMMAIAGAKYGHYATGKAKFRKVYDDLIAQYGVRGLQSFRGGRDWDDAEHVLCHLEALFRIEEDPELLAAYRVVLDAIWKQHVTDGQSLFTYIYFGSAPDAPDREKPLQDALYSLQTWPTDMTLMPRMNSIRDDLTPPYPVYAAAWDNEYIWKGNLLGADGWLSRTVTDVAVPAEDPVVLYAIDEAGHLYQSRDGGSTAAGWRPIDPGLPSPARAIAAGARVREVYAACDDGFYLSTTGGYGWRRLPVPNDGGRPVDIDVDPANPRIIYVATTKGVHRSVDFGEEFLGNKWETLTDGLPAASVASFAVALGDPGRVYAVLDGVTFTRRLDEEAWRRGGAIGLGQYTETYPWLAVDPSNPDRAFAGAKIAYRDMGTRSLLQETTDGGLTWSNDMASIYRRLATVGFAGLLASLVPGEVSHLVIDPRNPKTIYATGERGVSMSTDGGATWTESSAGLDIPVARSVFAPRNSQWLFAGTPAGLFLSKDGGENWDNAHLVLQFEKNTRREIGGAAFIDAYWRGRYYGFIDEEAAGRPFADSGEGARATTPGG
ncbi:MAG: hypothetical protein JSV65_07800 [Armatimonadota bacterium]|nr:MAG: hypothetical protein JSV65_07800 [Armatimonadota bacterium]